MAKIPAEHKKRLAELQAELKRLQAALAEAEKREGKDAYIDVKVVKKQGRFKRIKHKGVDDKAVGEYYLELMVTAKAQEVFIPLSIASGKKVAGFMYQIEGTAEGSLATTELKVRGEGVSQVTIGTLRYAKVPAGGTASFQIQASVRGKFGKVYQVVFTRLNYKLRLDDARYQQYLKEIRSEKVKFS